MTTETVHRYVPRGAAIQLLECRDPEVLISGPAGTGKSLAALTKLHMLALMSPGFKGMIIRKTRVSLASTALQTWRRFVVAEALEDGTVRYFGGNDKDPPGYYYTNGSVVAVAGMDKPSRIMSSELDVAFVQEAIELAENDWEAITTRLRNYRISFQQIIGDTNPDMPTHWLKQRCDAGKTTLLESRHEDNPLYFDEDGEMTATGESYLSRLDQLTGVRHARLRLGLWTAAEGLVYPNWDPAVHLVDPFPIPDDWPRLWAIDFGYTNPFVCQHWAQDPDGRLHLYREFYGTERLVEDWAADILDTVTDDGGWVEPRPTAVVCDHDAEGRATFERHTRLRTRKAVKAVSDGVQAVASRLQPAGDGRPRLVIHRGALVEADPELLLAKRPTCTAQEVAGYVWPKGQDGKEAKESPVKVDDHGMDALRYVVMHVDGPRRGARVRVIG